MAISKKRLESVIALSGQKRFEIFIKSVAGCQQAWGLYQDGWALAATDDGVNVFPLWPAKEYAEVCAENEWENFEPRFITLQDLLEVLLPRLKSDGVLPGVFYTPSSNGVTPSVDDLVGAINEELKKY